MSYYIRERMRSSEFGYMSLDEGQFSPISGERFSFKEDAVAAWRDLPDKMKRKHPRAYIIGPSGGCYRPSNGARLRKDPEA